MNIGDIITVMHKHISYVIILEWWSEPKGRAPVIGRFFANNTAIVLDIDASGCKILTSQGIIGWVHNNGLKVIN